MLFYGAQRPLLEGLASLDRSHTLHVEPDYENKAFWQDFKLPSYKPLHIGAGKGAQFSCLGVIFCVV